MAIWGIGSRNSDATILVASDVRIALILCNSEWKITHIPVNMVTKLKYGGNTQLLIPNRSIENPQKKTVKSKRYLENQKSIQNTMIKMRNR